MKGTKKIAIYLGENTGRGLKPIISFEIKLKPGERLIFETEGIDNGEGLVKYEVKNSEGQILHGVKQP